MAARTGVLQRAHARLHMLCLLGLVLACAGGAHAAASCQPLAGVPSTCKTVMGLADGEDIYVRDGTNVTALVKQTSALISRLSSPLGNKACYEVGVRFACAANLMRCTVAANGAAVPTLACGALCLAYNSDCAGSLELTETPPSDCTPFTAPASVCQNATVAPPRAIAGQTNAPSPKCVAWGGAPSICAPLVPTTAAGGYVRVFVPSGQLPETVVATATAGIASLASSPYTPVECYQAALRYICGASFMPCKTSDEYVALGFPSMYKSLSPIFPYFLNPRFCRAANAACRGLFAVGGLPDFNCTESDPPPALALLPAMKLPYRNVSLDVAGNPLTFEVPAIIGHPLPRCEAWSGQPSICGVLVRTDRPIFVDEYLMGGNQSHLVAVASAFAEALSNRFVPNDCFQTAMKFTCLQAFMPCYDPKSALLPPRIPLMPCQSLCEQANTLCAATLARAGKSPINCSTTKPLAPGLPCANGNTSVNGYATMFPTHNWTDMDCFPLSLRTDGVISPVTGPCAAPCFVPIIPPWHQKAAITMNVVFAALSTFSAWFLAFHYIMNPRYRSYPRNMPVWISLCSGLSGLSQWLPAALGRDTTLCADAYTPAPWGYIPCTITGALLHWAGLSIGAWWTCCAVNLYLLVVADLKKRQYNRVYMLFHICSWGGTSLATSIALGLHSIEYGPGQIWCFISTDLAGASIALFYGPFIIFTLVGMVLVSFCVAKIIRITHAAEIDSRNTSKVDSKGRKRKAKRLVPRNTYRMISFVIAMIFISSFIVGYGIDSITSKARKRAYFENYVECMFMTPGPECGGPMHENDYVLWYMNVFVCSIQGLVIFLVFGTNTDIYAWGPFVKWASTENSGTGTNLSKNKHMNNSGSASLNSSASSVSVNESGLGLSNAMSRSTEMMRVSVAASSDLPPLPAHPAPNSTLNGVPLARPTGGTDHVTASLRSPAIVRADLGDAHQRPESAPPSSVGAYVDEDMLPYQPPSNQA